MGVVFLLGPPNNCGFLCEPNDKGDPQTKTPKLPFNVWFPQEAKRRLNLNAQTSSLQFSVSTGVPKIHGQGGFCPLPLEVHLMDAQGTLDLEHPAKTKTNASNR